MKREYEVLYAPIWQSAFRADRSTKTLLSHRVVAEAPASAARIVGDLFAVDVVHVVGYGDYEVTEVEVSA